MQNADPCSSYLGRSSMLSTSETVVINGISFLKETGGDGAAGQIHQWVAYSTLRDHTCVTFDMILHITNPGNYLTPPPAFNETAEIAVLTNMVSTFTWLGATPTPTFTPYPLQLRLAHLHQLEIRFPDPISAKRGTDYSKRQRRSSHPAICQRHKPERKDSRYPYP